MSIEPSFHMDTSDINSKEDIEVQPVLNTKWKIVAVSNSKSENLKPMPVSHQGSLAKITSSLSGDEDDDGNSDKKEEKLERPKTAFYIPEQKLLMEQGEITAIPTRKNPFNSLPPPLPPRPATQTAPIFASSTNNNGINPPFSAAVQKSVVPQVLQPSTIQNLGKEKEIRLRKPPSLAKLEARKATQDDSKPTSLQNVNTESSLPLRPGNTINQYWKKLYYDQAEQYSQQITPTDMSTSVSGQSSSVASRVGEPVLSSTTTAYKAQHMQPPELVVPTPVIAKPQYEIRTLSPKTSLPPTAINLPILENNISFADSLESFAQLDLSHDDASDSVGSSDSFATARQYQSATSLTPEYLISSNPESSEVSASHSVVQGPRPQPWDDVEFGDFNIDKDAKTSTTTKAFRNMMKKDTISKIFKSAFQKNVVVPLENESYNQSQLQDLSRNTNSRLLGSRVFVEDQSSLDHSNRTSQSHTSSRVRGPRPPKF